jgi:type VI secretion system secreted protein VgrG
MNDALELFKFSSAALDRDVFKVVRFKGAEGLSKLFQFDVTILSAKENLDLDAIMDKPATFSMLRADQNVAYHGTLQHFDVLHSTGKVVFYKATLVPSLWWLTLRQTSQVFLDMTLNEILEAVLKDGGLSASDYDLQLQRSYPKREYVCQYNESNYDFLCRQMEHQGIYYYFKHTDSDSKLIITDTKLSHVETPQSASVRYAPPTGLESTTREDVISSFIGRKTAIPKSVRVKDYNYRKPSAEVVGKAEVDGKGQGEVFLYGEHVKTASEGEALAKVRAEEHKCREQLFYGSGTASFLRSGFTVSLKNHFRDDFNQQYLIIESKHQGSQAAFLSAGMERDNELIEHEMRYSVDFTAIPANVQFRPEQLAKEPRIYGTLNATIDAAGSGEYAELDEQGRYKVILPFDLSGRSGGKASRPLRMIQPYAGADHGMHFPLHKNTEVMLAFIDGDPDRPIIAGAAPNPDTPSLVKDKNQTQALIQTSGQNKLLFEDTKDSQRVLMKTPTANSYLRVGSTDEHEEESHEESGFRVHTEGKYCSEIGTDYGCSILGNKAELVVGATEEAKAGAFTEVTVGAKTDLVAGQAMDIMLGMALEVKKGKAIEIGEASRIGISQEEELLGAESVTLKAGGSTIGVKKAIASAIALTTSLTSASMAAAKSKKPHMAPKIATAATIGGISAVLWAAITIYLLKAKIPHQFKSSLEMDKQKTELKTPKILLEADTGDAKLKAASDLMLHAENGSVAAMAKKNISLYAYEKLLLTSKDATNVECKGMTVESEGKISLGVKAPSTDPIELKSQKIALTNSQPGGEITLTTDKLIWKPATAGQLQAGPLKINAATGQVTIG